MLELSVSYKDPLGVEIVVTTLEPFVCESNQWALLSTEFPSMPAYWNSNAMTFSQNYFRMIYSYSNQTMLRLL